MDEDDIYGSILSDPKSFPSNSSNTSASTNIPEPHLNAAGSSSSNSNSVNPTPWLFVSNLTWWTSEDDIRAALGEGLGTRLLSVHFIEHKPNGKSKGMAIIEFRDVETAEMAKERMEGNEINGKRCEIGYARSPPMKPFEKNSNYQRNPRPPNYYHNQPQYPPPNRPVEYEAADFTAANESARQVYRGADQGQYSDSRSTSVSTASSRQHRDYRDSRERERDYYHRESRNRSRSPDRRHRH